MCAWLIPYKRKLFLAFYTFLRKIQKWQLAQFSLILKWILIIEMYETYHMIEFNYTYNLKSFENIQSKFGFILFWIMAYVSSIKMFYFFDGIPRKGKRTRQSTLLLCKCAELIYHCPQAYESTGVKFIFYDFRTHKIGNNSNWAYIYMLFCTP